MIANHRAGVVVGLHTRPFGIGHGEVIELLVRRVDNDAWISWGDRAWIWTFCPCSSLDEDVHCRVEATEDPVDLPADVKPLTIGDGAGRGEEREVGLPGDVNGAVAQHGGNEDKPAFLCFHGDRELPGRRFPGGKLRGRGHLRKVDDLVAPLDREPQR